VEKTMPANEKEIAALKEQMVSVREDWIKTESKADADLLEAMRRNLMELLDGGK
jgi:hypothetical protein